VALDLENSLAELAAQRDRIAEEKIPLVVALNELESDVRELRNTATRYQAIRDSRELGLSDLQGRVQAWENENTYLINLLNEYASRFQGTLNISESERYRSEISDYTGRQNSTDGRQQLEAQLMLLESGLGRIRSSLGGERYEGIVAADDSQLVQGTFTRFGPLVYFLDEGRSTAGIVGDQDGIYPRILELEDSVGEITSLTNGGLVEIPVDATEGMLTAISSNRVSLATHISRGGFWIIPILFFALLSLAISLFKALQVYRIQLPTVDSVRRVLTEIRSENMQEALQITESIPAPFGPMLKEGVKNSNEGREIIEEVLYENILEVQPGLGRWLPVIATTAAIAPLLGLLGTVTGMINTFNLISLFGTGDARVLSSGISEALVTTEFGLIVAIPSLIVHAILSRRIKAILADMEKYALIFSNGLSARSAGASSP